MRTTLSLVMAVAIGLAGTSALAQTDDTGTTDGDVVDHAPLTSLLKEYVDEEGRIDYTEWHEDEEANDELDAYLESVANASTDGHADDARLAFFLNAYNAYVIDSILEEWPVENPQHVDGFFDAAEHRVAGRDLTLDALEHKVIRPEFEEPRIHFVLVCAAESCPRLRQQALDAKTLEETLNEATREFITESTTLEQGGGGSNDGTERVVTSKLFDWFADDFEKEAGSVRDYLKQYVAGSEREALDNGAPIEFRDYDWAINDQP